MEMELCHSHGATCPENLPDLGHEIPSVKAQVEQYHANLKIAQKTRDETLNVIVPKIQSEMEKLSQKLQSFSQVTKHYDKSNNSPGLALIAPTPPLAFPSRSDKTSDTPSIPALTSYLKKDTPDAVSSVRGKINESIRHNPEQIKGGLEALKKSTKVSFTKSDASERNRKAVNMVAKSATYRKEQVKSVQEQPPTSGKSSEQRKKKSGKNVPASSVVATSTSLKQSSEDLVNSIVDSLLHADTSHKDSWSLELNGSLIDHDQGQMAFVSKDLIHHSPQEGSSLSPFEYFGNVSPSERNLKNIKYQGELNLKSFKNMPLWEQTSPANTFSLERMISDQPSNLFSPVASSSAGSQLDSVASASNRSDNLGYASLPFSPVNTPLSSARGTSVCSQIGLDVSEFNALMTHNEPIHIEDSESKQAKSSGSFVEPEENHETKESPYKNLTRFPGDGQPSQQPQVSNVNDDSDSDKDDALEMGSMSKDSLFDPPACDKKVSAQPNPLEASTQSTGAQEDSFSNLTGIEALPNPRGKTSTFQVTREGNENDLMMLPPNLLNISSVDLLDLDSGEDILQNLDESFSPAKEGIVLESGRSPRSITSPIKHTVSSPISTILQSESMDRGPVNSVASAKMISHSNESSDFKEYSSSDSVSVSNNDDFLAQMALLQNKFASMVCKSLDDD
ncbi:hypothetical protein ElyMa_000187200 [Elysia marginata]|uniref:Uncharacterized protein n=1 Tax=Elysia marginata TaxID=1093978 RepID=A0AAV4EVC1_9GAST|nr:hypothetical protein ElyMa_000187200 [Elysia marginata]